MSALVEIYKRLADVERRLAGIFREGPVEEVDPKNHTVRLRFGGEDDAPFLSPAMEYAQSAGGLKAHTPPTKGQRMIAISPGGDWRQGIVMPGAWSDANKSPSEKGDENVITYGDFTITLKGDVLTVKGPKIRFECDGATFELTGNGLKMVAPDYQFD